VGFEPTYEGFAGPDQGDSDPDTPLAGFRVRVLVFKGAWPPKTLNRLLGSGNRHNTSVDLDRQATPAGDQCQGWRLLVKAREG
jgi:hypothetical protein